MKSLVKPHLVPPQETKDKMWGVFCAHCGSRDPVIDSFCSRYKCDYGYKTLQPPPCGATFPWQYHYDKQKRMQGEARAARQHKAMHELLGPVNDAVVTDTTSVSQQKVIRDHLDSKGHILVHVPAEPVTLTPAEREQIEPKTCAKQRAKYMRIYGDKKTPIARSSTIPWYQQKSLAYDKMVNDKIKQFNSTGKVTWPNIKTVDAPATEDRCEKEPLELQVGAWPGDITKPRTLVVLDNCDKGMFTPKRPANPQWYPDDLLGSSHCVVWSKLPDRRVSERRAFHQDKVTEPWHPL